MGKRSKRQYRSIPVVDVDAGTLLESAAEGRLVVGIDVAKEAMVSAVMDEDRRVVGTIRWSHPFETPRFVGLVRLLAESRDVEVAMEPSGVYGDALRWQLLLAGFEVHRVSPKRSHDMAEVYDGVPSIHDAKSAAIVARLHLDRASEAWPVRSDAERRLVAALHLMELHDKAFRQHRNRLEAQLSRHWPELGRILELGSATLLEVLAEYGGPAAVAAAGEGARLLMTRTGGFRLDPAKVEAVLRSAARTVGVPQIDEEVALMRAVSAEARRERKLARDARKRVRELGAAHDATHAMQPVIGKATAAVLVATAGDPRQYDSAKAYLKALGLNLRVVHDSGTKKSGLHISKRGSGTARMYLYLAALRHIKGTPVVRAWFRKKVDRDGGQAKSKAVIAVVRKLVMALWHVARGARFEPTRLYDVRRLSLEVGA